MAQQMLEQAVNKKVRNYKNFKPVILRKKKPCKHNNNGAESVSVAAIGLNNIGNSCFINSSLQVLMALEPFTCDVLNIQGALQKVSFSIEDNVLLKTFMSFILAYSMNDSLQSNKLVKEIKEIFAKLNPDFRGNGMQDGSEFITKFLQILDEETGKILSKFPQEKITLKDVFGQEQVTENRMNSNFMIRRKYVYTCQSCGHQNTRIGENLGIFVHLSGNIFGSVMTSGCQYVCVSLRLMCAGPCDFSVSPSPQLWTSDSGLTILHLFVSGSSTENANNCLLVSGLMRQGVGTWTWA